MHTNSMTYNVQMRRVMAHAHIVRNPVCPSRDLSHASLLHLHVATQDPSAQLRIAVYVELVHTSTETMLRHEPCAQRWPGSHPARAPPVSRRSCTPRHRAPCSAACKNTFVVRAAQPDDFRLSVVRPPTLSPLVGRQAPHQRGIADTGCHAQASSHHSTAALQEGKETHENALNVLPICCVTARCTLLCKVTTRLQDHRL